MSSPNKLTFERYTRLGYECATVEQWIPHANQRRDLFGIGDILAVKGDVPGVTLLQATTGDNMRARIAKALKSPHLVTWLAARNRFVVVAWQELPPLPGAERARYVHLEREITLDMIMPRAPAHSL